MENKTCGECKWFGENRCNLHNNQYIFGDRSACKNFAPKEDKTCGEYRYYKKGKCYFNNILVFAESIHPCWYFKAKPTNGDRIRQMSNEELAELIVPKVMFCDGCPVKCQEKDIPQLKENPFGADVVEDVCKKRVEAWLNAPAESEVGR